MTRSKRSAPESDENNGVAEPFQPLAAPSREMRAAKRAAAPLTPQTSQKGNQTARAQLEDLPMSSPEPASPTTPRQCKRETKARAKATKTEFVLDMCSEEHGLPTDLVYGVLDYLLETDDILEAMAVSRTWRRMADSPHLWRRMAAERPDGDLEWRALAMLGEHNRGTEGVCFKARSRITGQLLAVKRARVYPKGEGVPYYMLRELSVLQGLSHRNVTQLQRINLTSSRLHVVFDWAPYTLQDFLGPETDPKALPEPIVRSIMHQVVSGIASCHRRGVLHRNLKPKHVLISPSSAQATAPMDDVDLGAADVSLSDFALVRAMSLPRRAYTSEVVTLWYRPPEILMGEHHYGSSVDVWALGCIMAEMICGAPLFTGISEIDQLFQIFSKLGVPSPEQWPGFRSMPNYSFEFPHWPSNPPISKVVPGLSALGQDLIARLLTYDPARRISAEAALRHPYFSDASPMAMQLALRPSGLAPLALPPASPAEEARILFHNHLREKERAYAPSPTYLSGADKLRPNHRAMLVDWLVEVVDVFEMCFRTTYLAVNFTDRFLERCMVSRSQFQLLGATCLHAASKLEDVSYIGVEDLANCADNLYTSDEVLEMEERVLNQLDFRMAVPTTLDFLCHFQDDVPLLQPTTKALSEYLAELSLLEYELLQFPCSMVATCALSLALMCTNLPHWSAELEASTRYCWTELAACMRILHRVHAGAQGGDLQIIPARYQRDDKHNVASIHAPMDLRKMSL